MSEIVASRKIKWKLHHLPDDKVDLHPSKRIVDRSLGRQCFLGGTVEQVIPQKMLYIV